jgi:hypothetical protein
MTDIKYTVPYDRLFNKILPMSVNQSDVSKAIDEWRLQEVFEDDLWTTCVCGVPIKKRCVIKNLLNKNSTIKQKNKLDEITAKIISNWLNLGDSP